MTPLALTNPDPLKYSWWLMSRAAGITALVFVTASTVLGLFMASGIVKRPGLKGRLMPAHEYFSLFAVVAIFVHGLALLGDNWLKPSLAGIFVPGVINYRPLAVAVGIVSGYITVLLSLSYYLRRQIGIKRWRQMHRFIVVVWVMAIVHSFFAGTDASTVWMRVLLMASIAPTLFLTLYRWLPEENRHRDLSAPGGTKGETVIVKQ
jgi:predicted ferric reductase